MNNPVIVKTTKMIALQDSWLLSKDKSSLGIKLQMEQAVN